MFKINFILTCEKAELIPDSRKSNFYGIFDTIYASSFPAIHKSMTIVVNFEKEPGEHQEFFLLKKGNVEIFTGPIVNFKGQRPRHQFVHRIENVPLPWAGKYEIEVYVNNKLIGSYYFFAELTK